MTDSAASKKGRTKWIDVYKGLAILLVVLGHQDIPAGLYRFIFAFHLYAFFFVSGRTFRVKPQQSFWQFLAENARRLLIPYLFFAFAWDVTGLGLAWYQGEPLDLSLLGIGKNILSVCLGGDFGTLRSTATVGPAWFLLSLFVVRVGFYILVRLFKDKYLPIGITCAGLFILGYVFNGQYFLPFKIIPSLTAFLFFFGGYYWKFLKEVPKGSKGYPMALGCVACFGVVILNSQSASGALVLAGNALPKPIMCNLVAGVTGCLGLLCLSSVLEKLRFLAFLGVNSMTVMGIHSQIRIALAFLLDSFSLPGLVRETLIFAATLAVSIPVIYVFNRYFPILVGKRKEVPHD